MADNVVLNSGSGGETCATDDVSGVQYQIVKLADGTANSSTVIVAGGGVEASALRVTLASDSTGVLSVDDNGSSLTVDGTVAATQSGTWTVQPGNTANTTAWLVTGTGGTFPVTDSGGSLTVDNAGTFAVQAVCTNAGTFAVQAAQSGTWNITNISGTVSLPTGASTLAEQQTQTTALQLIDDAIYTDDADWTALTSKHALVGGVYTAATRTITDGDTAPFSLDVNGHTIVSPHGTSTALADNVSNTINLIVDHAGAFAATATVGYMFDGSTWDRIRGTSADGLLVNLGSNNDITVTSGTVTTVTTLTGGGVAHDSADSGNPIKVGAKASATLSDDTMVANADRTDLTSDLDGAIITRPQFPLGDLISERVSNTDGASTAFTNFGATASTRNYIYGYSIFRTDAGTTPIYVDFRDGTAGSILWSVVIPPNGGANLSSPVPLFRSTANTAIAFDVSAATTTVYISVNGCKSKV